MDYISPLHIVPVEFHDQLDAAALKKLKKRLLLQFELEGSVTIVIGEREYDKNEILSAVDELSKNPDFHLKLHRAKPLLAFIEKGTLDVFYSQNEALELLKIEGGDEGFINWVLPVFCHRLGKVYATVLAHPFDFTTHQKVKKIWHAAFQLPEHYQNEVYGKVYGQLSNQLDLMKSKYEVPVRKRGTVTFKEGIEEYISFWFASVFKYFPESLLPLRDEYCRWCNNMLNQFLSEENDLANMLDRDLEILDQLANNAALSINSDHNKQLSHAFQREIKRRKAQQRASSGRNSSPFGEAKRVFRDEPRGRREVSRPRKTGWAVVILVFIGFLRLGVFSNSYTHNSRKKGYTPNYYKSNYYKSSYNKPSYNKSSYRENLGWRKEQAISELEAEKKKQKRVRANFLYKVDYHLESVVAKGEKVGLPYYLVKLNVRNFPRLHKMDDELDKLGPSFLNEKIPYDSAYIKLVLTFRNFPKVQRTFIIRSDMWGYHLQDFIPKKVKTIRYNLNEPINITGKGALLDQTFTFFANINKKTNEVSLQINTLNEIGENSDKEVVFSLSTMELDRDTKLSSEQKVVYDALVSYMSFNGKRISAKQHFYLNSLKLLENGDIGALEMIKDTTTYQNVLHFKNKKNGKTDSVDIDLYYDYNNRLMKEYQVKVSPKMQTYSKVYMWAYR